MDQRMIKDSKEKNREAMRVYNKIYRGNNKEKISLYRNHYRVKHKEYFRNYLREYKRNNRPLKICWRTIQNGRLHAQYFDEETMFTIREHQRIYSSNLQEREEMKELAILAELKYNQTKLG